MEKTALSLPQVTADLYRTAAPAETLITVLLPVPADLSRLPVYKKDRAALLALTGLDWDALPPWPAPPLRPEDAPFTGGASEFLAALTETILPEAERAAGLAPARHFLLGISLSGLFALWASCMTDRFAACAALSGSFWYDGFTDWLGRTPPACPGSISASAAGKRTPAIPASPPSNAPRTRLPPSFAAPASPSRQSFSPAATAPRRTASPAPYGGCWTGSDLTATQKRTDLSSVRFFNCPLLTGPARRCLLR